jgi:hypothetical protein
MARAALRRSLVLLTIAAAGAADFLRWEQERYRLTDEDPRVRAQGQQRIEELKRRFAAARYN